MSTAPTSWPLTTKPTRKLISVVAASARTVAAIDAARASRGKTGPDPAEDHEQREPRHSGRATWPRSFSGWGFGQLRLAGLLRTRRCRLVPWFRHLRPAAPRFRRSCRCLCRRAVQIEDIASGLESAPNWVVMVRRVPGRTGMVLERPGGGCAVGEFDVLFLRDPRSTRWTHVRGIPRRPRSPTVLEANMGVSPAFDVEADGLGIANDSVNDRVANNRFGQSDDRGADLKRTCGRSAPASRSAAGTCRKKTIARCSPGSGWTLGRAAKRTAWEPPASRVNRRGLMTIHWSRDCSVGGMIRVLFSSSLSQWWISTIMISTDSSPRLKTRMVWVRGAPSRFRTRSVVGSPDLSFGFTQGNRKRGDKNTNKKPALIRRAGRLL